MAKIAKLRWKKGDGVITADYENYCFVISWMTEVMIFINVQVLEPGGEVSAEISLGQFPSVTAAKAAAQELFPYLR